MRRVLGAMALLAGTSLWMSTTVLAKDPEGRVINAKPRPPVKRLVDPAPPEPTPAAAAPAEAMPAEMTPTEATPLERTPTEATPRMLTPSPANESGLEALPEEPSGDSTTVAPGKVIRTFEQIEASEEEKRRAAAGKQAAAAQETQMLGRIRNLQTIIAREEQLLAQRLAYAAKLRDKGLATNDEKVLSQAEQFERAALAEYLKKVQQFERASIVDGAAEPSRRPAQPPRTSKNPGSAHQR